MKLSNNWLYKDKYFYRKSSYKVLELEKYFKGHLLECFRRHSSVDSIRFSEKD